MHAEHKNRTSASATEGGQRHKNVPKPVKMQKYDTAKKNNVTSKLSYLWLLERASWLALTIGDAALTQRLVEALTQRDVVLILCTVNELFQLQLTRSCTAGLLQLIAC